MNPRVTITMDQDAVSSHTTLGNLLLTNRWAQLGELLVVFLIPGAILVGIQLLDNPSPMVAQASIALAMVIMIGAIWFGLRLRGQTWQHLGLKFGNLGRRKATVAILQSLATFIAALAAFIVGTIVMQAILGQPEGADLSGYDSLKGNLPLLLVSLVSVYITASFGEEVVYRGFLMTRLAELFGESRAAWVAALGVSSIIFGCIHFQWGLTGIVQTGFMGLALGIAYLVVRRNLWVTILAHGYMDTLLILPLYFGD